MKGIEPPLLAEHDFEFVRVYQFRHTGLSAIYIRAGYSGQNENRRSCFHLKVRHIAADRNQCAFEGFHAPGFAYEAELGRPACGAPAARAALAIFAISLATLLGAWYFPIRARLSALPALPAAAHPLLHRHSAVAVVAIAARATRRAGLSPRASSVILIAVLCGAALGAYHAGVEWHFWPGPPDCSGPLADLSSGGSLLDQLKSVHVVRCDQAAWRFLGISLAGYNALISLAMAVIAGYGLAARASSAGLTARRASPRRSPRQKDCSVALLYAMPRCNALRRSINVPMTTSRESERRRLSPQATTIPPGHQQRRHERGERACASRACAHRGANGGGRGDLHHSRPRSRLARRRRRPRLT